MPVEIITVPCLSDNYAYVLLDTDMGTAAVVDVPEAGPINAVLAAHNARLTTVLITHHHSDHIAGTADLTGVAEAEIIGAAADAHRLPPLTQKVAEGDNLTVLGKTCRVFDVSGHTLGHVAFYFPTLKHVFTADSLMALGCGRLFEGAPGQMWDSLLKLRALPNDTVVCSGHEYTQSNAKFARSVDPDNTALQARAAEIDRLRAANKPTVPSLLGVEKQTNPFLLADDPRVMRAVNMADATPAEVFAEVRKRKDIF